MKLSKFIAGVMITVACASPTVAAAETDTQLVSLYQQLIGILTQELTLLKKASETATTQPAPAPISIDAPHGTAPYIALISLGTLDGTEAVDFGDGHSTGSGGCVKNARGYCDLKHQMVHTYQFPGTYTVTLYRHSAEHREGYVVSQRTVVVQ